MTRKYERTAALAAMEALRLGALNHELCEYWLSLWDDGRLPARGAINPGKLGKFLSGLAILEIQADDSIRFRIAGRAFQAAFGFDPSRHDMMALTSKAQRAGRLARCRAIVAGTIGTGIRIARVPGEPDVVSQDVVLPLGGPAEDGARAWIFHTSWRPGAADWSRQLPAEVLGMSGQYDARALR